jgi:hypothetical protein
MVKDRKTKGDSTREVGDRFLLSLPRIIEESTSATADPWYAFNFPLETYHILLSSITLYYTSRQYLNNIVLGTSVLAIHAIENIWKED